MGVFLSSVLVCTTEIRICERFVKRQKKLTIKTESGAQPLTNADETIAVAANGEIYNHRLIRKHLKHPYHFKTTSDCEVIIPLVSLCASSKDRMNARKKILTT